MAQTIIVDTTPGYRMPTIYYSQGDIGRTFSIDLQSRFGESLPASPTITIQATKPSGLGFSVGSTSVSGAVVTFTVTETMSNEAGRFPAELKIVKNGVTLFTANFYIDCEANAHPEGTTDGDIDHIMPKFMSVTTTTLPAGDSATYSFDANTNTATFGIPKGADGSLASQVLAADYSSSKTYAVGDYVYYSGNLYRCTTAITTAEAWTAAHWTQVALANDVSDVKSDKVPYPIDPDSKYGTSGQVLRTKGNGATEWASVGLPTDEQTAQAVSDWLDNHPEATTTVQDGSLTEAKFSAALKLKAIKDYVTPEMFGAVGDGVADDTDAIKAAVAASDSIMFVNEYKVTDTIYLPGGKNLDIFGTVHYTGAGKLFHISHQFNNIDGHNIGTITGGGGPGTLIYITTTDESGTEKYSYFNKIINITIRESARGIMLYNPETTTASYFNTIDKCTFFDCPIGIELKGYADGNRLNNIVFYNCGVANDLTKASIVFTEDNSKYPMENNISQVFVTNSYDCVCFLINGHFEHNCMSQIIVEPGGNSRSIYSADYSKITRNQFQILGLSYYGIPEKELWASNSLQKTSGYIMNELYAKKMTTPLSRVRCYSNPNVYSENSWIPLLKPSISNLRSMRVSLVVYVYTPNMFVKQYYDPLNTIVYNYNNNLNVTNSALFKIENGTLYFLSQPIYQGTPGLTFKIELTVGSYFDIGAGLDVNYTMESVWSEI